MYRERLNPCLNSVLMQDSKESWKKRTKHHPEFLDHSTQENMFYMIDWQTSNTVMAVPQSSKQ